eukprot:TRINITY_DN6034_c0_g1_i2.p1 TRINITY_DN6034_c0_g1~~TRINITY_DN6034_c0_g1_i2.p1  ORF type:complete len:353 (-),score=67.21 TRINITY_DN6034_c0_g1_i2:87-1082(-)
MESQTGQEARIAKALGQYLTSRGWKVSLQYIHKDTDPSSEQANLLAYWEPNCKTGSPRLIFNSHLDTVPPYIPPRFDKENGIIYGRGACDAKGQIVSQILAAEALVKEGLDVGLLYVVEEEMSHIGIKRANLLNLHSEFLVVGEPTESKIATQQKGVMAVTLKSFGVAAHSGYPETGRSAIVPLVEVLHDLNQVSWPESEDGSKTTLNIGVISGGAARNVVPEYAEARLMFRLISSPDSIYSILEKVVNNRVTIVRDLENGPIKFNVVPGIPSAGVSYNTDIPYYEGPAKPYLFGPGSILVAHTPKEQITLAELNAGIETNKLIARHLLHS